MAETLLLKTDKEPTFWNKEAAIGTLLAGPIGLVVGGLMGKSRMAKEKETGKPVSNEPSFWNKDALLGGLLGGLALSVAFFVGVVALAVGDPTILTETTVTAIQATRLVVPLLGMATGAYYGGQRGQEKERAEFAQAKVQQPSHSLARSPSREQEMEISPGKNFTKTLDEERARAQDSSHHL